MGTREFNDDIARCNELFETSNFYEVLGLVHMNPVHITNAKLARGLYLSSLYHHESRIQNPRRPAEEIELATRKLRMLTRIYSILTDFEKKQAYDRAYGIPDYERNRENADRIFIKDADRKALQGFIPVGANFDRYRDMPVFVRTRNRDLDPEMRYTTFEEMELPEQLLRNVLAAYSPRNGANAVPLPIQQRAIRFIFEACDILGWSPTGSGKTAAYAIPMLVSFIEENILEDPLPRGYPAKPYALVLVPTRELALQVSANIGKLAEGFNVKRATVFGGRGYKVQLDQLYSGCHILLATPGRLEKFIGDGLVTLSEVQFFVLDEADVMLDMGFGPSVDNIVESGVMLPKTDRHTLLFSATFPRDVQELAKKYLNDDYVHIEVDSARQGDHGDYRRANPDKPFVVNPDITQEIECIQKATKLDRLVEILNGELEGALQNGKWTKKIMVFDERKNDTRILADQLVAREISAAAINGDKRQLNRESALVRFANGKIPVLVATSVAARGLDIMGVDLVINYQLPSGYDDQKQRHMSIQQRIAFYIQRIGRTGRVGNPGRSISFYDPNSEDEPS